MTIQTLTSEEVTLCHSRAVLAKKHDGTDPSFTTLLAKELQAAIVAKNIETNEVSGESDANNEELSNALSAARSRLQAAVDDLGKVLDRVNEASGDTMLLEAQLSTDPTGTLAAYAYQNRAEWSGGPFSATNIKEHAASRAAIYFLRHPTRLKREVKA